MATNATKTTKYLKHSDEHFQDYWIQLQSLIRKHEDADEYLDGLLENPLDVMRDAVECWEGKTPPADDEADLWAECRTC